MRVQFGACLLLLTGAPALAGPLKVMTYNILHGQPCTGGSLGSEVGPRMDLAVGGIICTKKKNCAPAPGLAALAPDILGMQEVSQVLVTKTASEDFACQAQGIPEGVTDVEAYEHAGDHLLRKLNGATAPDSPYRMRFVRDNPRLLPLVPDVPLPPDDKSLSDHSAELGNVEIGLAVISKLRIQQVTVHNLTIGEVPGETRAILHATLRDDTGNPYDFYDSHLTTTGGDSPQTILMATEIARFITTTRRHPENPGFFTCDCNATDDTATYRTFTGAGFVDSYRVAHSDPADPAFAGLTSGRDGLSTSCEEFPPPPEGGERIDYVWALPDSAGDTPPVLSSSVVMNYHEPHPAGGCRWPSDHNGVITTFGID